MPSQNTLKEVFVLFNKMRFLSIIIMFQFFLFSMENNISGIVLDSETQDAIHNANIFIKDQNIGTISDKNGYFLLSVKEANQIYLDQIVLNISIIGYEKKEVSVELSGQAIDLGKILIIKKPIELEALQIHSHKNESAQISDILISGLELDENLKGNIAATLSNYPNIGINSFGSVVSKPALRGFSGDRFLLTKDGFEVGDLSQSSIDHVITLDMSEVSQIEIVRGPRSLVFGENAIGGVVNTSLYGNPKFRAAKFHQRHFLGQESFNSSFYGNMMAYVPIGRNQVNLLISNRNTKNETSPIGELDNTQSHIDNYKFGFTHYSKKGYINYSLEDFNMDYGIPANQDGLGHPIAVDILLNKRTGKISYHQDISLSSFSQLDIDYSFIEYLHLEDIDGAFSNGDVFENFNKGEFHVGLSKNTQNLQIQLNSSSSVLGVQYNKKDFKGYELYFTPDTKESYFSIYGFKQKNFPNSDFDLLGSFRLGHLTVDPNKNDIQYNNLYPADVKKRKFENLSFSFGFKKEIDDFEINSWIMQTMRSPRVEELYSDGPHLGTYSYEIGNPNLKVEKIYGVENSISFKGDQFDVSLVTFYNYSPYYYEMAKMGDCPDASSYVPGYSHPCGGADYIEWGSGPAGFLYKYNSRGSKAVIKGLELDLGYTLGKFELNYDFSYVSGYNKTLDRSLSYINPMKQILSLSCNSEKVSYKIKFSKINAQDKLGEFETYTPGAFLTDFIITYNYKRHNIAIQLNNVFDEIYYNHLSRIKDITPEPGRNIVISSKVFF